MVMQNITLSGIKFRASLLWSQFASGVNLKPSVSSLLIFLGVCFSLPVQAHSFNEAFDSDPTTGASVSTFPITAAHSVTFKFTFTTDGDRGAFAYDAANGDGGTASIKMVSNIPGSGTAPEQITIARNDGLDFAFNSLFISNFGDVITVGGYNGGTLVSAAQMASGALPVILSFGGIVVDEIRLTSANFNANIDSFNAEVLSSPPANTAPTISIDNTNLTYTENAAATQIDSTATLTDADGDADWNGGTLVAQITANNEAADELSIPDNIVGSINTSGTTLLNGVTSIGTLSAVEGTITNATALTITFNGAATNALVEQVLQAIHYRNISETPGETNRTVTVTATDANAGNASDVVTGVNDAPTGSVVIDNVTPAEGQTLTVSNTLADADGLGVITYQWKRDIGGVVSDVATGTTYVLTQTDVGSIITVTANYTDGGNIAESETSAATAAVTNVNNTPTGSVIIDNLTPAEGQTLTASNTLADADGLGVITYQWKRDVGGVVSDVATGTTYVLTQTDVEKHHHCYSELY